MSQWQAEHLPNKFLPRNPNRIGFWQLESIDMPRFDLRQDHDTLKPLASFQVLTVMW